MNVNPFSYLIEKLKSKLDITGGTISGNLLIDRHNGTTNTDGQTILILGNTTPSGTDGNSYGIVRVCGKGNKYTDFEASLATSNQLIKLPNASGTVALEKSNDTLYDANPGTSVSSETFANGHKASEYKFIAIEMYWGGLSHSLDVKVIPSQAWIGTDAFKLINANGNVNLTVSNRTNTGFDIVANNGAVSVVIEGIY